MLTMKVNLVIFVFRKISGGFRIEIKRDSVSGICMKQEGGKLRNY